MEQSIRRYAIGVSLLTGILPCHTETAILDAMQEGKPLVVNFQQCIDEMMCSTNERVN